MRAAMVTVREVLADIPHDGGAIFLYVLLALCLVVIWRAGRSRADAPVPDATEPHDPSHERSR